MRIVGVLAPGAGTCVDLVLNHGDDPRMLLWREGWVLTRMLSTHLDDQGIVLTVQVRTRNQGSRPPRIKSRGPDPQLKIGPDEVAVRHQRVAAGFGSYREVALSAAKRRARAWCARSWKRPDNASGSVDSSTFSRTIG